ncbi:MAG: Uncharacterized protein JWO44_2784 [Bacteroidetes bacterium]|nr:Uncharacterized protein [Bacteroidota bacterium]
MTQINHLIVAYQKLQADNRLRSAHVSLYMALFNYWNLNKFENPVTVRRRDLMPLSKIKSKAAYHKCIKELDNFGYIKYLPSYNPFMKTTVTMNTFNLEECPHCKQYYFINKN